MISKSGLSRFVIKWSKNSFPSFEHGNLNKTKVVLKNSVFSVVVGVDVVVVIGVGVGVAIDTKGLFGLGQRAVETNFIVTNDKLMQRTLSESQTLEFKFQKKKRSQSANFTILFTRLGSCMAHTFFIYRRPSLSAVFLYAILHICNPEMAFFLEPIL